MYQFSNADSVLRNYILGQGFAKPRLFFKIRQDFVLGFRGQAGELGIGTQVQGQSPMGRGRTERFFSRKILLVWEGMPGIQEFKK